jgi:hypothetical protein
MELLVPMFKAICSVVRRHAEYLDYEMKEKLFMGSYEFIDINSAYFADYGIGWSEVAWPSIIYLALV